MSEGQFWQGTAVLAGGPGLIVEAIDTHTEMLAGAWRRFSPGRGICSLLAISIAVQPKPDSICAVWAGTERGCPF